MLRGRLAFAAALALAGAGMLGLPDAGPAPALAAPGSAVASSAATSQAVPAQSAPAHPSAEPAPARTTPAGPAAEPSPAPLTATLDETASVLGPFSAVEAYIGIRNALTLVVANTSSTPLSVSVSAAAVTAPRGVLELGEAESVLDPSRWVSGLPAAAVAVAPGGEARIPFEVSIPNTAGGGDYPLAVVVADSDGASSAEVPLLLRVPGDDRTTGIEFTGDLALDGAATWPLTPTVARLGYELRNSGSTVLYGDFDLGVGTLFSQSSSLTVLERAVLLPGAAITGSTAGAATAAGVARPELVFTARTGEAAEAPADWQQRHAGRVVPAAPAVALALPFAVIVVVAAVWSVARRRSLRAAAAAVGRVDGVSVSAGQVAAGAMPPDTAQAAPAPSDRVRGA